VFKKMPDDIFALAANPDGGLQSVQVTESGDWPGNTFVIFTGVETALAPDWKAFIKLVGAIAAKSRDNLLVQFTSLWTERIGSFLKLGEGIDFTR